MTRTALCLLLTACAPEPPSGDLLTPPESLYVSPNASPPAAWHDDKRHATCWVIGGINYGMAAISCLPDSALASRPEP